MIYLAETLGCRVAEVRLKLVVQAQFCLCSEILSRVIPVEGGRLEKQHVP